MRIVSITHSFLASVCRGLICFDSTNVMLQLRLRPLNWDLLCGPCCRKRTLLKFSLLLLFLFLPLLLLHLLQLPLLGFFSLLLEKYNKWVIALFGVVAVAAAAIRMVEHAPVLRISFLNLIRLTLLLLLLSIWLTSTLLIE